MATSRSGLQVPLPAGTILLAGCDGADVGNPRRRVLQTIGAALTGTVLPVPGHARAGNGRNAAERAGLAADHGAGHSAARAGAVPPAGRFALAATWQDGTGYFVGVLVPAAGKLEPLSRQRLPTRAHGIAVEEGGTVLVAARRPGDWLVRFDPRRGELRNWFWSDGEHSFNGHVVRSADGRRLFTTETAIETGEGSVAVRDRDSLSVLARWPTAGKDPHELVLGPEGGLWVANGGLETRQETGRTKHHLDRMDSSLVRLDAGSGRITGQWRLADPRLGLRHIAVAGDGSLAIALQAEHDDPEVREAAPVLALWDRRRGLRAVDLPPQTQLAGYGGSVAVSADEVAVGCPRAGLVARWRLSAGDSRWQAPLELPEACATAAGWHGGAGWAVHAFQVSGDVSDGSHSSNGSNGSDNKQSGDSVVERLQVPETIRLDNHWALVDRAAPGGVLPARA